MPDVMTHAAPSAKPFTASDRDTVAGVRIVADSGEQGTDATKAFADDCWRRDPRISPDSWRLSHGYTVAKLWLDGRKRLPDGWPAAHAAGANGVLLDAATLTVWQAAVTDRACWLAAVVLEDVTLETMAGADVVLATPAALHDAALLLLEQQVQAGTLMGYGVMLEEPGRTDLQPVLERAKAAAQVAWGRRKRPALRAMAVPFGVGHEAALRVACCTDGTTDERTSQLEWAARRDLLVLALNGGAAYGPDGSQLAEHAVTDAMMTQAAEAIMVAADAEQALAQALSGWPERQGEQVFSIIRHLQQGVPLWPGRRVWRRWQAAVWPELQTIWRQVAELRPEMAPQVERYLAALRALDAMGEVVADSSSMVWQAAELTRLQQYGVDVPVGRARVARAQVVASVAGISGVVGAWQAEDVRTGLTMKGVADVAPLLGGL